MTGELGSGRGSRLGRAGAVAAISLVVLAGCWSQDQAGAGGTSPATATSPAAGPTPGRSAPGRDGTGQGNSIDAAGTSSATVVRVIDGDTLVTDVGRVRLLGIDTPERGRCGFGPATSLARRLLPPGSSVSLVAAPGHTQDRYGRLLRYVEADGVDVGAAELEAGLAVARYDSRDGYGWHPRQEQYIALDAAHLDAHDYPNCPVGLR